MDLTVSVPEFTYLLFIYLSSLQLPLVLVAAEKLTLILHYSVGYEYISSLL